MTGVFWPGPSGQVPAAERDGSQVLPAPGSTDRTSAVRTLELELTSGKQSQGRASKLARSRRIPTSHSSLEAPVA